MSIRIRTLDETFSVIVIGSPFKSVSAATEVFQKLIRNELPNRTRTYQVFSDRTGYVFDEYSTWEDFDATR